MPVPARRDYPWHPSVERMVTSALEHYGAAQLVGVLDDRHGARRCRCDDAVAQRRAAGPSRRPNPPRLCGACPGNSCAMAALNSSGRSRTSPAQSWTWSANMPFVKRDAPASVESHPNAEMALASAIGDLTSPDTETRWSAARALGDRSRGGVRAGGRARGRTRARVREAIMTALMRIGDEASVKALLPYLRSQDAGLRAAADRGTASLAGCNLAIPGNTAGGRRFGRAHPCHRACSKHARRGCHASSVRAPWSRSSTPTSARAAIEVLAEVGTSDAIPALQSCADRFAEIPFLSFAVSTAIARISNSEG